MDILVTNEAKENQNYDIQNYETFFSNITSEEGFNLTGDLYIDINCIEDENTYDTLNGAIPEIKWISFNNTAPDWYVGSLEDLPKDLDDNAFSEEEMSDLASALSLADVDMTSSSKIETQSVGRIVTFGSAKGGSGKTFTSIISAVYYAKDHPKEKVCLLDLDIEEPQVAIVIQKINKTIKPFYAHFLEGETDFQYLEKTKANNENMPDNLDFYLSPREEFPIRDENFWETVMANLFMNYDMVVLDTGTTYMETSAIISAYKIADKINIVTMCNLASTVTVSQQMKRLSGEIINNVYRPEDEIEKKVNLIVTNSYDDIICDSIINKLEEEAPVIAKFGNMTQKINEIQFQQKWSLLDSNEAFREGIRDIMS